MNGIKVSIKVLCYNQEKYIRETLDSILNQVHPYTYEVIVCDDASQDSTPQIVAEYASRFKEIVPVLREKNIGLIANYFDAISRCRGEYIMGCAGDDYWLPGKVAKQVEYMDTHPNIGMVYGDAECINFKGDELYINSGKEKNDFESLIRANYVSAPTICVRHSMLNIYISEINPINKHWKMEDYPMLLWFSMNSEIKYLQGECVAYRVLDESISHSRDSNKIIKFTNSVQDIRSFFLAQRGLSPQKTVEISNRLLFDEIMTLKSFNEDPDFKEYRSQILDLCNFSILKKLYSGLRINKSIINRIHCHIVYRLRKLNLL